MSSVLAYPPAAVERPYYAYVEDGSGERVSGADADLLTDNGVAVHWKGEYYDSWNIWKRWWVAEPIILFDIPAGTYETVFIDIDFKYSGCNYLWIYVFYSGGGSDHFEVTSTGGNYVFRTFYLESNRKVSHVSLWAFHFEFFGGFQQHIYVDYICIGYSNY